MTGQLARSREVMTRSGCGSRSRPATGPPAPASSTPPHGPIETPAFIPLATKGTVRGLESARGRRARLRADPRQHLPPVRLAGAGADRRRRRPARVHGLGAGADHRLRRLPGLLARPRRRRQRGQGQRPRPAASTAPRSRSTEEGVALPLLPRRLRAVHLARGLDAGPGGARLRHRPRLRRVHALPRRPRVHRALDRAHPPLARPLPRLARARGAGSARRSSGSSRAASTRTCGASRRRRSPRPASTGSRSAAPSAATRRRWRRCSAMTAPLLPEEAPKHLLGIGEVDDLLGGIALGLDVFDCAVPTRLARHGVALAPSPERRFRLDLRKGRLGRRPRPAGRGLPLPGLPAPRPRLPQLPLARRGADRGPPASSSTTSPTCTS